MNLNQIAFELYGKSFSDLNPIQQNHVIYELERRMEHGNRN